ncbi:hypothetical protein J2Z21_003361 [Streptomyces griseochromogenes]|uniref:RdlA protein n=1 Tax=Streptomyces griseochromogenes TaxID=68214 RepID=A0A1B1B8K1_9ACTN|nr:hypothetical protein [Streptomyces griseochromogenes]ANP55146.1 hypothetical protein AVL59_41130 [Streptomyces griseochromogenes]MBP2050422.1 hypothetical protein [Streptomyces griseochromogenes]
MRKLQQVALVFAAAGGLSAIGTGPSVATPVEFNGAVPPPVAQPDTQAGALASSHATARTYGTPAPAPQRPTEITPQVNPQLNPQINPQISPQATPQAAPSEGSGLSQSNLFRPAQECSPQNLLNANLPVGLLGAAQTKGVSCTQANSQANAASSAH